MSLQQIQNFTHICKILFCFDNTQIQRIQTRNMNIYIQNNKHTQTLAETCIHKTENLTDDDTQTEKYAKKIRIQKRQRPRHIQQQRTTSTCTSETFQDLQPLLPPTPASNAEQGCLQQDFTSTVARNALHKQRQRHKVSILYHHSQ